LIAWFSIGLAVVLALVALRVKQPKAFSELWSPLAIFGAGIAGALAAELYRKRPAEVSPEETLETTTKKYETEDDFDDFALADTLDLSPAPDSNGDLDNELEEFRRGADELIGTGRDSSR